MVRDRRSCTTCDMLPLRTGLLVAFEGIDGAGKTTQATMLAAALAAAGVPCVRSKEPTDGPWGAKLRASASTGRLTLEEELAAFVEDRREHVRDLIAPKLASGHVVILDRYYFSTAAYQGARGADPVAILAENEAFAPRPDVLVLLDVDPSVGVQRIRKRGDIANLFEKEEDLRRSAEIFATLTGDHVLRLDGALPVEAVAAAIHDRVVAEVFRRKCIKVSYKNACEPAYCAPRIEGRCDFPAVAEALTPGRW